MREKCFLAIFLLGWNLPNAFSFGKRHDCRFDYFAFDENHLECLRQHVVVKSIEENLRELKSFEITCHSCKGPFPDSSAYLHLSGKRYLALSIEKHAFGGYTIFSIFDNEPRAYSLWLYPSGTDLFQLREIKALELSKQATRQMFDYAKDPRYSKYWRGIQK